MLIGFDLISDLNLKSAEDLNWENKATSLYCLIAGNISDDMDVVFSTLSHLSNFYQGVFYVPGSLEFSNADIISERIEKIEKICKKIKKVAMLHHHVVVIDGVAVLGCTGWYGRENEYEFEQTHGIGRFEDIIYLKHSLEKLQKHLDVKKILLLTNSVPNNVLYFGKTPEEIESLPEFSIVLSIDSESKVSYWAYGNTPNMNEVSIDDVNYYCNPCNNKTPYWAKRINVRI